MDLGSVKESAWWSMRVPRVGTQAYLNKAEERGANAPDILRQADISLEHYTNPEHELQMLEMLRLFDALFKTVGDNGLGIEVGWHLPPTAYGNFGYALLCSESMRDVADLCHRFWHLVGPGASISIEEHGDQAVIELTTHIPIFEPVRHVMFETGAGSICRGIKLLLGREVEDLEVWFDFDEPEHSDVVRQYLKNVRYNMPVNQMRFPIEFLDAKLDTYNPEGLEFAIAECKKEEIIRNNEKNQLLAQVLDAMSFGVGGYPSLQQLADTLNITPRTLRRRLEKEGTNYKSLLEDAKRRDAIRLLDDRKYEIQKVAELLGYQDPANFTRAFRQWTGQTPSEYRSARSIK